MAIKGTKVSADYGEATVTSKGQITVPGALRRALGVAPGDRLRFLRSEDGSIRLEARKPRRIVEIARANPIRAGAAGVDLDATIEASVAIAIAERRRRSGGKSRA
jgi:AbrB family looped-hinge helix DNA binding protein